MKLSINSLFLFIAVLLGIIVTYLKPLNVHFQKQKDAPEMEMKDYEMYELDTKKLVDISKGEKIVKYKNRYEMFNFDYIDNSDKLVADIKGNFAKYTNNKLYAQGDIEYTREDGLKITSEKIFYDRSKMYVKSLTPYVATMGKNRLVGNEFRYHIDKDLFLSTKIKASYFLE